MCVSVVHTSTAVAAANVLKVWCPLLPQNSKETIDFIKVILEHFFVFNYYFLSPSQTYMSNKTTHPQLRVVYLWCVLGLCKEEIESSLLPLPLQSLERVSSTTSPQHPALEEAVIALHVILKTSFPDTIPSQVWSLADSHSEQIVSNKLLTAASQESEDVCMYVEEI